MDVLRENPARALTFEDMMQRSASRGQQQQPAAASPIRPTTTTATFKQKPTVAPPGRASGPRGGGGSETASNTSFSGSDLNHPSKCICEICTCGRHHCPPRPKPVGLTHADPRHFTTNYTAEYVPHDALNPHASQRRSHSPQIGRLTQPALPDQYDTNYTRDYVPREVSPQPRAGSQHNTHNVNTSPLPDQYDTNY
eukprot:PhM_4_TR2845/c1_g1_i1/m.36986